MKKYLFVLVAAISISLISCEKEEVSMCEGVEIYYSLSVDSTGKAMLSASEPYDKDVSRRFIVDWRDGVVDTSNTIDIHHQLPPLNTIDSAKAYIFVNLESGDCRFSDTLHIK